jgi:hypothetical protein
MQYDHLQLNLVYEGPIPGTGPKHKCVRCGKKFAESTPFHRGGGSCDVNPLTFRWAWMHKTCLEEAMQEIIGMPAPHPERGYVDRADEWFKRWYSL